MVYLRDNNNRISGEIPSRITESKPSLKFLQLRSKYVRRMHTLATVKSFSTAATCSSYQSIEFANLKGLQFLNLSRNNLSGSIPNDIGNMTALESLDLSCNAFSGLIPTNISSLTFLSSLNLSNNTFTKARTGGQLETLNDPSIYSNNFGLCGTVLSACPIESSRFGSEPNKDESRSLLCHNHRSCYWILAMVWHTILH
uniref:non-specific serine/threonine protein kinase n=1 Tax=Oryza punctata TaxID=4537 RepID=A0A0E0MMC6_ORYPU